MNTDFDPFEEPRAPAHGGRSKTTGRPSGSRFSAKTGFFAVMIALGIFIGAIWSLYPNGKTNDFSQNVPIVRAESKPLKVVPEDAGGMEIPHRDSTVFSALNPDEEERPRIENLLASDEDEEPLPRSQLFAGLNTEGDDQDAAMQPASNEVSIVEEIRRTEEPQAEIVRPEKIVPFETKLNDTNLSEVSEKKQENVEVILPVEPAKKPEMAPVKTQSIIKERKLTEIVDTVIGEEKSKAVAENKVEAKKVEEKPVANVKPKTQPPVAAPSGSFYVQLASVKNRLVAESEWSKLRNKYKLSSAYRIQQKDLGAKGTFYRIQAGPYPKSTADSICNKIKAKAPGGCLVTK